MTIRYDYLSLEPNFQISFLIPALHRQSLSLISVLKFAYVYRSVLQVLYSARQSCTKDHAGSLFRASTNIIQLISNVMNDWSLTAWSISSIVSLVLLIPLKSCSSSNNLISCLLSESPIVPNKDFGYGWSIAQKR